MKIMLDLPDTTMAVFINYIFHDGEGVVMKTKTINDELYSGNAIKCEKERENDADK